MTDGWSDARLETTYSEARAVLEAQNDTISDVDDKAMRTVRVTVIVVGLVASAVRFAGNTFDVLWLAISGVAYVGALVTGVLTYAESTLYLEPGRGYVERLRRNEFGGRDWRQDLLATYGEWIEQNDRAIRPNGQLLFLTRVLLVAGVASTAAAIAF
ncbi:hypothetical protein BRC81_04220 [Halobacteriales archaeon QS_1_68_20]|nr:MAG: hypothetical protein BRC81_04220 [Halobacteriales archaeon QS_1_68_20]